MQEPVFTLLSTLAYCAPFKIPEKYEQSSFLPLTLII